MRQMKNAEKNQMPWNLKGKSCYEEKNFRIKSKRTKQKKKMKKRQKYEEKINQNVHNE